MPLSPQPFTVAVPNDVLNDLQSRLKLARFPDELDGAGRAYGSPLGDIQRLVARWRDGYDWRRREAEINKLPQYTLPIEVGGFGNLDIHFIHQRSTVEGAIPLLFVHGWPGHFLEVEKVLPLLTAASPDHPSFHVVAPSLPGFGFSEGPSQKGFVLSKYAEVLDKLMLSLGYNKYVTQGGDWGNQITRVMAVLHGGTTLQASHSNFPLPQASAPSLLKTPLAYAQYLLSSWGNVERARRARTTWFDEEGFGYNLQQGTRPQTLGYALADSPVGLLGWIYEKLIEWSDNYPWTDDEVLDWVMIYWLSRAGPAASLRIYYERLHASPEEEALVTARYVAVPYGISLFPLEIGQPPLAAVYAAHNVVFVGEHAHGGHFAAHEQPLELVGDVRKMFGKGGAAYGVVPGTSRGDSACATMSLAKAAIAPAGFNVCTGGHEFALLLRTDVYDMSGSESLPQEHPKSLPELQKRHENVRISYHLPNGAGASGFEYQNSDWVVALDPTTFAINVAAGGPHYVWVRVSDALGKTALARIGDICYGMSEGRLSLSQGLFEHFAPLNQGVFVGSWAFVGPAVC